MKNAIVALAVIAMLVVVGWWFMVLPPVDELDADEAAPSSATAPAVVLGQPSGVALAKRDVVDSIESSGAASPSTDSARAAKPPNTGGLRGRLVDSTGVAVARVQVEIRKHPWVAKATSSDNEGRFELNASFAPGTSSMTLNLVARGARYATTSIVGNVHVGQTTDIGDVFMKQPGIVSGRVLDKNGRGLSDIEVRCTTGTTAATKEQFRGPWQWSSDTTTDATGAFRMTDVQVGSVSIWAGAADRFWACTPPFELAEGREFSDIELVVHSIPREDMLIIKVLDPENQPVAGADVRCHSTGVTYGSTDGSGRFVHYSMNPKRVPVTVIASDPYDRWLPVVAEDVLPGTLDLVLQLGRAAQLQLRIVDASGAAVEIFGARCRVASEWLDGEFPSVPQARHANGLVDLVIPTQSFSIEVDAPTFALAQVGPFESATAPVSVEVALRSLPGMRGLVRTGAAALEGASVTAHVAIAEDEQYICQGLPARHLREAIAKATTDARGEFVLTLRESGNYWVRAKADGLAATDLGPIQVDAASGVSGLLLELTPGGSIEGRIVGNPGEDTAGLLVAASRGDSFAFTVGTDANGAFSMDHLTPGSWWVALHNVEIKPESMSSSRGKQKQPLLFVPNCSVVDGQTTRMEILLHPAGEARLQGRLALSGVPAINWQASLTPLGPESQSSLRATLDGAGEFRFAVAQAGPCELSLESTLAGENFRCSSRIQLEAGDNPWVQDLPTGGVAGQVPLRLAAEHVRVRWARTGGGALWLDGSTLADGAGRFAFARIPAGPIRLVVDAPDGSKPEREVQLAAGESLRVDF